MHSERRAKGKYQRLRLPARPERIDSVRSDIAPGGLLGMPYVMSHENAMQAVVAALKPTRFDHSPRSVRDDFSYSKAFVLEGSQARFDSGL